jgi:Zn-dependent protease
MEQFFLRVSIMLVPILMAVTCHEVSHGFTANKLGDNTAKSMGRLTLNPIKHLDIIGTLLFFYMGFGWAKPVPVNFNNLRHPKRDMIWVAAAGPITNFALAFISAFAMRLLVGLSALVTDGSLLDMFIGPMTLMLAFSVYINLLLGIFNLIPVPPLDGGRVAVGLLPYRLSTALARLEPFGMFIIIAFFLLTNAFNYLISPALSFGIHLLAGPQSYIVFDVNNRLMMR